MNRIKRLLRRVYTRPLATLPSVQAYSLWAASYPPYAHNRLMEIEQEAMTRLMPPLTDQRVLDLACGSGRYSVIAQEAGAKSIIGVDNSVAMLKAYDSARRFIAGSMTALPFAAHSFDVILCGLATGHLPSEAMRQAIREMARVLAPGGKALFSDFHPFLFYRGGQRSFTAPDGKQYAVEHYPHLIADYFNAIKAAGMDVLAIEEPYAEIDGQKIPAVLAMLCQLI